MFETDTEIIKMRKTNITVDKDIRRFCLFLYNGYEEEQIMDIIRGILDAESQVEFEVDEADAEKEVIQINYKEVY